MHLERRSLGLWSSCLSAMPVTCHLVLSAPDWSETEIWSVDLQPHMKRWEPLKASIWQCECLDLRHDYSCVWNLCTQCSQWKECKVGIHIKLTLEGTLLTSRAILKISQREGVISEMLHSDTHFSQFILQQSPEAFSKVFICCILYKTSLKSLR